MLMHADRSLLLVVDIQEKLLPVIENGAHMAARAALAMQAATRSGVPVILSEQNPKGLGESVAPIEQQAQGAHRFSKLHFSCAADPAISAFCAGQKAKGRDQMIVCGIEAHICVLQSALGFLKQGFQVTLLTDAVSSFSDEATQLALQRARQAGAQTANTEMMLFEWMEKAGTNDFRAMLDLVKALRA